MATIPLSATDFRLLSEVPFSIDRLHTKYFTNRSDQYQYFNGFNRIYMDNDLKFIAQGDTVQVKIPRQIDQIVNGNYAMFRNANTTERWYFAYVIAHEYVSSGTTKITLKLDSFQSYLFDLSFKPSMIAREHTRLWNTNGTPVINTVNEQLDYGSAYDIAYMRRITPFENIQFLVIVAKETFHIVNGETEKKMRPINNGLPQPLTYYVHPFNVSGSIPTTTVGGTTVALGSLESVLEGAFANTGAVDNIVNMYVTDITGLNVTMSGLTINFNSAQVEAVNVAEDGSRNFKTLYVKNASAYSSTVRSFGGIYPDDLETESKLMMSPYLVAEFTDFQGTSIPIALEHINNGGELEFSFYGSLGVTNKTAVTITGFNESSGSTKQMKLYNSLISEKPRDIPILSDYLSAYLQGNKNALEFRQESNVVNTVLGVAGNVASGFGNPVGSAVGVVSTITSGVMEHKNMQAQLKDIANKPPNLVSQGSNANFTNGHNMTGHWFVVKRIKPEYKKKLSHYFNMYGYQLNEVKVPNLRTRQNWNFVQMLDPNIIGSCPQDALNEIKDMFKLGLTLWHTNDIYNYNLPNGVI